MQRFDILYLSDLHLAAGDIQNVLVAQSRALADAGYSIGLLSLLSRNRLRRPVARTPMKSGMSPEFITLVDPRHPVEAQLVIAAHPAVFAEPPLTRMNISCFQKILLVPEAPRDGLNRSQYDPSDIVRNAALMLDEGIIWTPVSPQIRRSLVSFAADVALSETDWPAVLDLDDWDPARRNRTSKYAVLGRFGQADPLLWPETPTVLLQAYPARSDMPVRILGAPPPLLEELPNNWVVVPKTGASQGSFLDTLDHYVYFHQRRHIEGYSYALLKAMAAGVVPILPTTYRDQLDGAAAYGEPKEVVGIVENLRQGPQLSTHQGAAVTLLHERFSPRYHIERVRALIGRPSSKPRTRFRRHRRVIFFSSNGIGLGHLTRQMAIARRCADWVEPIFVTMSQAVSIVSDYGWLCEYIPHHHGLACSFNQWNTFLEREIAEVLAFYRAEAFLFDGNVVYPGLAQALRRSPDCWRMWCRRPMWRPDTGAESIANGRVFDLIVEPKDVAGEFDTGPTRKDVERTHSVGPIRFLDTNEQLSRRRAREELGIENTTLAVLLQLGAGNNRRSNDAHEAILSYFAALPHIYARLLQWPISNRRGSGASVRPLRAYPVARLLRAFDATVSAAGYNSFHDIVANRMPAVFVPNENPMMDDQLARAHHAAVNGYGLVIRESNPYEVAETLDQLFDPDVRRRMSAAAAKFPVRNAAADVARLLEELLLTNRVDRDHRNELLPALSENTA